MRFFSGTRDKKPGKLSASTLFKQKQNAKAGPELTRDEKYKQMLEARVAKLTEDAMMGKKTGGFKLPGTKGDDKPRELSKNAKQMIEALAMKKMQKDRKIQKKKQVAWERGQKAIKNAKTAAEMAADAVIEQAKKDAQAAIEQKEKDSQQQSPSSYYFFGRSDDKDD